VKRLFLVTDSKPEPQKAILTALSHSRLRCHWDQKRGWMIT